VWLRVQHERQELRGFAVAAQRVLRAARAEPDFAAILAVAFEEQIIRQNLQAIRRHFAEVAIVYDLTAARGLERDDHARAWHWREHAQNPHAEQAAGFGPGFRALVSQAVGRGKTDPAHAVGDGQAQPLAGLLGR